MALEGEGSICFSIAHLVLVSPSTILPSIERTIDLSLSPLMISVGQKRPHILPKKRAFKTQSPLISPTTRAEICCKVPIKSPYPPKSVRDPPPLGEADVNATLREWES